MTPNNHNAFADNKLSGRDKEITSKLARASTEGFVTVTAASEALSMPTGKVAGILSRLEKKGWVRRVRRGVYFLLPLEATKQEGQGKAKSARPADTVAAKHARVAKTTTPAIEATKQRKAKAESASSDDATDGRKLLSSKPKVPPIEVKKQDAQRKAKSGPAGEDGKAAARLGAGKPARDKATAHCSDCVR